ncbi:MAG: hypothetical protein KBC50_02930 [Candidatus Pacebacteria bacterium]|nr:hypothetical protein [Candidatus Paceibacterota bacterium]
MNLNDYRNLERTFVEDGILFEVFHAHGEEVAGWFARCSSTREPNENATNGIRIKTGTGISIKQGFKTFLKKDELERKIPNLLTKESQTYRVQFVLHDHATELMGYKVYVYYRMKTLTSPIVV